MEGLVGLFIIIGICGLFFYISNLRSSIERLTRDLSDNQGLVSKFLNMEYGIEAKKTKLSHTQKEIEALFQRLKAERAEFEQLMSEKGKMFPTAVKTYVSMVAYKLEAVEQALRVKKNPALKAAETVSQVKRDQKFLMERLKKTEFKLALLQELIPEAEEVIDDGIEENTETIRDNKSNNLYISKEEWDRLSEVKRSQLELDRYNKRHKSKWEIGREYERYIGHLYELKGYRVDYIGALKGLEDAGRDVIAELNGEVLVIQAKYWSKKKTIHEKHVLQTFGTAMDMALSAKGKGKGGVFDMSGFQPVVFTSTKLSDRANAMAKALNVHVIENGEMRDWPQVKCNINGTEKIYHLPTDQQYDRVKIEKKKGEAFVLTAEEAEKKGFRRARKYFG